MAASVLPLGLHLRVLGENFLVLGASACGPCGVHRCEDRKEASPHACTDHPSGREAFFCFFFFKYTEKKTPLSP